MLRRPVLDVLVAVTALVALTACTSGSDDAGGTSSATPSSSLSASDLVPSPSTLTGLEGVYPDLAVQRAAFCDLVPDDAVLAALGRRARGTVPTVRAWADGDTVRLSQGLDDGVRDVAHEYGCRWTASGTVNAQAWVYAPPVDDARATTLADGLADSLASDTVRCSTRGDAEQLGSVGATAVCTSDAGRAVAVAGLLGDGWLTCTVSAAEDVSAATLLDRSSAWCTAVALAAASD
ncbi:hypothetical protein [Nocardioides sp. GY 10127]|uniref:hypothetical protein n=1 Tax=Nocardioides sp. GY 10127 TaxID=2569762 RepID=UPI0010A8BDD8|nr:hypothetical protein [Nocardioides sp. GY 10127]TIC81621.1 hypothetical protein E8D37_10445 [Nocardioides sp. GY 10127]